MKRLCATLHVLGLTLLIFAFTILITLVVAYWGGDEAFEAFLDSFILAILIGGGVCLATLRRRAELRARDGFVLVSMVSGWPCL